MKGIVQAIALVAFAGNITTGFAAIVLPPAPEAGRQLISQNIAPILHADPRFFNGLQSDDLAVSEPHRVYSIGLTNLAAGQFLSAAKSGSWRYLLLHDIRAVGEVSVIEDQGQLHFGGLSSSRFADETRVAVENARASSRLRDRDYELRFLDIPSIHFVAVWFHADNDDVLVPLRPAWSPLKVDELYSENEIVQVIRPQAQRVLDSDGKPTGAEAGIRDRNLAIALDAFDRAALPTAERPTIANLHEADDHPSHISFGIGLQF